MSGKPQPKAQPKEAPKPATKTLEKCEACGKTVYAMEKITVDHKNYHERCFKCAHCNKKLEPGTYSAGHHGNVYCKPHYTALFMIKGNYSGSEQASSAQTPPTPGAAGPPPPPPAAPASLLADINSSAPAGAAGGDSGAGMAQALAQIATGGPKLKHVSREERKRPPASSLVPGDSKTKEKEEKGPKDEKKPKGDPTTKLDDKKWTVRFHTNRQENPIVIDITSFQQSVAISNCEKAVVQIKGKCTNISVMNCTSVGVIFDDVVAACEVIRSKKLQLQANGALAQIALDNSSGVDIFVQSAAGKTVEIVTALCEGVNVTFPGANAEADPTEYPIPMQFISNLKGGKLITAPSSHV